MNLSPRRVVQISFVVLVTCVISSVLVPAAGALVGADVVVTATGSPDPVEVGEQLTLTLTVRNEGSANADQVVVSDAFVPVVDVQSVTTTTGSCTGTGPIVCTLGTVAPAGVVTITVIATPDAAGQLVNTATATALVDADLTDNTAVTNVQVDPASGGGGGGGGLPVADLAVAAGVAPDPGAAGAPLTYVVSVSNFGPDTAHDVTLVDTLPVASTLSSVTASQGSCSGTTLVTCSLGSIAAANGASVTMVVVPTSEGVATNSAVVSSTTPDLDPLDNQVITATTVGAATTGSADVAVTIDDAPDPASVGSPLGYVLTVTNAGPDGAENVIVVATLAPSVTFSSATSTHGTCAGSLPVTCDLGALQSGSNATIEIGVVPTVEGEISTAALAGSSTVDPSPLNNQVVELTTIGGTAGGTSRCTITGTRGADVLRGTDGPDVICGLRGVDRLVGLGDDDILIGGPGNDVVRAGTGNDRLLGGAGSDALGGSGGRDVLTGGSGRDRYSGGPGRDRCLARPTERARGCE